MDEYIEKSKILSMKFPIPGYFSDMVSAFDIVNMPAADVAPVVHGKPVCKNRPERVESFSEAKLVDGEVLYRKSVAIIENNLVDYCSVCGKRLCSRFTNYCPNCGAKMDMKQNFDKERTTK